MAYNVRGNDAVREHERLYLACERNARIVIVPAVVRRSRSERVSHNKGEARAHCADAYERRNEVRSECPHNV